MARGSVDSITKGSRASYSSEISVTWFIPPSYFTAHSQYEGPLYEYCCE